VREVIFDDPKESLARAEHALELSEGLAGIGVSQRSLADLKARAWMELGNARRVVSDFPGAHQAFAESRRELDADSGEREHEGLYGELFATLLLAQRRFAEGLRWADRAIRAERRAGNRHREGRCLVVKAQLLYHSGERERALQTIELSLGFLDPHREPNVFLAGLKNVAFILDGLGRHEEALARIQRLRPVFAQSVGRTLQLNFSWIEGRIAGRAGDVRSAEAAMQGAMMGFAEQGNLHDAAQAALELANLYLEAGRGADVERLAAWAHMTFSACRIDQESLAALLVWREAARAHTVTVELLASLGAALSARLRHRPTAGH
jgi:tetratricopeptide (TPR) repeat protein